MNIKANSIIKVLPLAGGVARSAEGVVTSTAEGVIKS
jgi:hypothetical protein